MQKNRTSQTLTVGREIWERLGGSVGEAGKRLTLGFGSGHHLKDRGILPHIGLCADSVEPTWDSLSLPLFLPLPCSHALTRLTHTLSLSNSWASFTWILWPERLGRFYWSFSLLKCTEKLVEPALGAEHWEKRRKLKEKEKETGPCSTTAFGCVFFNMRK